MVVLILRLWNFNLTSLLINSNLHKYFRKSITISWLGFRKEGSRKKSKDNNNNGCCFRDCFRYLGVEPRLNSGSSSGSGGDGQAQIVGAGVIGPASAEKNCKSVHLTAKQQAICSRSPPVLQVFTSRQGQPLSFTVRINGRGSTRLIRFAGPPCGLLAERLRHCPHDLYTLSIFQRRTDEKSIFHFFPILILFLFLLNVLFF